MWDDKVDAVTSYAGTSETLFEEEELSSATERKRYSSTYFRVTALLVKLQNTLHVVPRFGLSLEEFEEFSDRYSDLDESSFRNSNNDLSDAEIDPEILPLNCTYSQSPRLRQMMEESVHEKSKSRSQSNSAPKCKLFKPGLKFYGSVFSVKSVKQEKPKKTQRNRQKTRGKEKTAGAKKTKGKKRSFAEWKKSKDELKFDSNLPLKKCLNLTSDLKGDWQDRINVIC